MKSVMFPLLAVLSAAVITVSCQKESNSSDASLSVSKSTSVKKGEPVTFTMNGASGRTVTWTVTPAAGTQVVTTGNTASIRFSARGEYLVAAAAGDLNASARVNVTDTVYVPDTTGGGGSGSTVLPIQAGDKLAIQVAKNLVDSGGISTAWLQLSAVTQNAYTCAGNSLLSAVSNTGGFAIDYSGVFVPAGCTSGSIPAGNLSNLSPVFGGSTPLSVRFRGITYTGTIQRTGNAITIAWPDSSVVRISPRNL